MRYVIEEARGSETQEGSLLAYGRRFRAAAFPIGIDTVGFAAEATEGGPDGAGGGPAVAAPAGDAPREADVAAMLRAALRKLSRA